MSFDKLVYCEQSLRVLSYV